MRKALMNIRQFPYSESPNAAILRLTKNFGLKQTHEHFECLSLREKTKIEHAAQVYKEMCNLLQKMKEQGIKVITLEEDKYIKNNMYFLYPDQAFLTDTGHYFLDNNQLYFLPAFFKNKSRRGEEKTATKLATRLGATILPLHQAGEKPIIFEGGDLIQAPGRSLFFLGYGQRTQRKAFNVISKKVKNKVIPIELLRKKFFHLDCCVLPLPNDALVLYEGEYLKNHAGNLIFDKKGLPLLKKSSQTISNKSRILLRELYDLEKIILLTPAEALAYAANAVILKSNLDKRYKMFVNGTPGLNVQEEHIAIRSHMTSYFSNTKMKILELTGNIMDIIEIPYKSLHSASGSMRCTVEETFIR